MPIPLDMEAQLKAEILNLIYQAERRYWVRIVDMRIIRAQSNPPAIVGIEFDIVDHPTRPGPSETKDATNKT